MNENKKAVLIFLLGFVTLGIANVVYIYLFSVKISRDYKGDIIYPIREVVLNCLTIGIYGIIWTYKVSKRLDALEGNEKASSQTLVTTIVSALPIRCISMTVIFQRMTAIDGASE